MPKMDSHLFDTRLIRRNLKDGLIKEDQLAKHLASLDDMTGKFEIIKISTDRLETGPDDDRDGDSRA
jgi:hypothetical protein